MKTLEETLDNMRHFDWNDDVYDCKEVMNGFADEIESASSESRNHIKTLKLRNAVLESWIKKLCDMKERGLSCEKCVNMICPLCKNAYDAINFTDTEQTKFKDNGIKTYVLTMHNGFTEENVEYKTFAKYEEEAMKSAEDVFDSDWCVRSIREMEGDAYY